MKKAVSLLMLLLILTGCAAHGEEAGINDAGAAAAAANAASDAANEAAEDAAEDAAEEGGVRIAFEDGFSLEFPEGWQYYAPDEDMRAEGVHYCLSDAEGENWLYIGSSKSALESIEALHERILSDDEVRFSGVYSFGGVPFVVYDLAEGDVSCCAALLDGTELSFRFTPQSDAAFMALATQIMYSFALV